MEHEHVWVKSRIGVDAYQAAPKVFCLFAGCSAEKELVIVKEVEEV